MRLQKKGLPFDNKSRPESVTLPRFSFEIANQDRRPLVSTERLFHRLATMETGYDPGDRCVLDENEDVGQDVVVTYEGPNDLTNPLNWSWKRKWVTTILVSMFTFISPFSSTMVTPALPSISDDFAIPEGFMQQLVMSIFLLGYAQGPFVLAPLSEIYGRVTVLQYANLVYLVFNTACGFAQNRTQMLVFRLLSGIGGSAPQALCNGVLADTWSKEERGKGQAIYGMLTFIGPCVAPICGAYISMNTSWRWIFWSTSIFDVFVQILAVFFLSETFAPAILAQKAKKIRKELQRHGIVGKVVRTEYETGDRFSKILRKRLVLPFIMLFTHPAVQAPSIYRAYLYGIMYLVLSTFPLVFEGAYNQDTGITSLNYLSLCLGFMIGLQISHPLMDKLYARFKISYNTENGLPEWRVPPMLLGGLLCPIGLFIYGWTAYHKMHWAYPNLGCVILAIGLIIAFQCSQAYTVDAYSAKYAASAAAVGAFLRTIPESLPLAKKDAFAQSIEEVCSASITDEFAESRSGSTYFTIVRTQEAWNNNNCKAQFDSIISKCVADQGFRGGNLIANGQTFEVSTDAPTDALKARAPRRGGRGGSRRTRKRPQHKKRPSRTRKPKKTKSKKPKSRKPKSKRPAKKPKTKKPKKPMKPRACPMKGAHGKKTPKHGLRSLIPGFLLRRGGPAEPSASNQNCNEEVTETKAYLSAKKAVPNLKPNDWYKFTSKSPYTKPGPNETPDELKQLQERLGFDHIAVVAGMVKGDRDERQGQEQKDDVYQTNFEPSKVYELDQGAKTSAKKADKRVVKKKADDYFDSPDNKMYSVENNNCDTFAQAIMKEI
ncbi:hypothetical protein N0V90_012410 [Kalmusia sp. IMI 367209]|nr:hypothetical protein N0V90_012410 [Kalmusia sp. IMI 367209]